MSDVGRFALCVPQEFLEHYNASSFEISGLLQWARVFNGDVVTINMDLTPYDTIMTNVSSTESEYISLVRQENPSANVIACLDYGFSVINQYFIDLTRIKQVMSRADVLFSVNRNQRDWMQTMLPDKQIHYIPHPTDIENMLKFKRPREARVPNSVAYHVHQYDNAQIQGLEVLKAVERKLKRPLRKSIIGVKSRIWKERGYMVPATSWPIVSTEHPDSSLHGQSIDPVLPEVIQQVPRGIGWDLAIPYLGVEPFYSFLAENYVALDLYTVDSIGRFGMDCAGVGVPLVASSKQDSSKMLYPFSTVDPFSPTDAVNALAKLLKGDTEWYERVERTAMKNLEHYSFRASKERMLRAMEG